ncbi:MAG TPA: hypothetical protein VNK43_11335, partial [Gemmatimonadales bacterium]|nr:hypothetical protein [Gemmatimonadales bacterium]
AERARVADERATAARRVDRPLLVRYDKLKRAKASRVVVPLNGSACGACFTNVPLSRRGRIRSGLLVDGCEACGVILYAAEQAG